MSLPELPDLSASELLTADFDAGYVIRPGDVLLLTVTTAMTHVEAAALERQLRERLPKLADVILLGGIQVAAVFRDDKDES